MHFRKRWCILNESTARNANDTDKWPVGQGVKTSPSHGENTGSIPVLAAIFHSDNQNFVSGYFFSLFIRSTLFFNMILALHSKNRVLLGTNV